VRECCLLLFTRPAAVLPIYGGTDCHPHHSRAISWREKTWWKRRLRSCAIHRARCAEIALEVASIRSLYTTCINDVYDMESGPRADRERFQSGSERYIVRGVQKSRVEIAYIRHLRQGERSQSVLRAAPKKFRVVHRERCAEFALDNQSCSNWYVMSVVQNSRWCDIELRERIRQRLRERLQGRLVAESNETDLRRTWTTGANTGATISAFGLRIRARRTSVKPELREHIQQRILERLQALLAVESNETDLRWTWTTGAVIRQNLVWLRVS